MSWRPGDAVRSFRRQRGVAAFAVMTHNVLTGLKRIALKPDYLRARPKRLRFKIFCSPGKLIHHARGCWRGWHANSPS